MTRPNPFGVVTAAEASASLSALSCPTAHRNALPVETVDGERVATLCPDCDQQLPASWRTAQEVAGEIERSHRDEHHGSPHVFLLACRLCAEEGNPNLTR